MNMQALTHVRLVLDVAYHMEGESIEVMVETLKSLVHFGAGNGLLTGVSRALVNNYSVTARGCRANDLLDASECFHRPGRTQYFVLLVWGDVEPDLHGPYDDPLTQLEVAQELRRADGNQNSGIYNVIVVDGVPQIAAFSGGDLDGAKELSCLDTSSDAKRV